MIDTHFGNQNSNLIRTMTVELCAQIYYLKHFIIDNSKSISSRSRARIYFPEISEASLFRSLVMFSSSIKLWLSIKTPCIAPTYVQILQGFLTARSQAQALVALIQTMQVLIVTGFIFNSFIFHLKFGM